MTWTNIVILIVGMGVITYVTRSLVFIVDFKMSPGLNSFLSYVPFSILSALIFPMLLIRDSELNFTLSNHYLIAGFAAVCIALILKKPIITVISGIGFMLILKIFIA